MDGWLVACNKPPKTLSCCRFPPWNQTDRKKNCHKCCKLIMFHRGFTTTYLPTWLAGRFGVSSSSTWSVFVNFPSLCFRFRCNQRTLSCLLFHVLPKNKKKNSFMLFLSQKLRCPPPSLQPANPYYIFYEVDGQTMEFIFSQPAC